MSAEIRLVLEQWKVAAEREAQDDWCNTDDRVIWQAIHKERAKVFDQCANELEALLAIPCSSQEAHDAAELASIPVSYETPVDHYREMARRFSESRDELKHRCRTLEGELAALKVKTTLDLSGAGSPQEAPPAIVAGYDATFWHASYTLLRDAITTHLNDCIRDDDVAEEAILVEAIETAGQRLRACPEEPQEAPPQEEEHDEQMKNEARTGEAELIPSAQLPRPPTE
jgi:hypothetical protein